MDKEESDLVTFVNRFALHTSGAEFEEVFAASSGFMAAQPGFVRHTLLCDVNAPDHYLNIAHWADEESFRAAVARPWFAPHRLALGPLATSDPTLYRPRLHRGADRPDSQENP